VFWALVPVMLLGAADQALVAPALGAMARTFDARDEVVWVVTAYLLSATASAPLAGRLSDLYGRRSVLLGALGLFLAGALVCGWAASLGTLVAGRSVQGLGGGALVALPNAIVADILTARERGRYQAYISCTHALAGLAGPLAGALLSAHASWRWIYWLQVPLIATAAALCWRTLDGRPAAGRRGGLDPLGVALMSGATACLLLALSWSGRRIGWMQPPTLALLGAAAALAGAFLGWQTLARYPLVPASVRRHRVVAVASAVGLLVAMVHGALYMQAPVYLQGIHAMSGSSAGTALAVPLAGVVLGAFLSGQYMRRSGRYKPAALAGLLLATIAAGALAWAPGRSAAWTAVAWMLLLGLGIGASQPPMTLASQNAVPPSEIGIATALQMFARAVGAAIGVAASSALVPQMPGPCAACADGLAVQANGPVVGPQTLGILFAAFAAILGLASLAATRLPVLPFREPPAHAAGPGCASGEQGKQPGHQVPPG
jgi:MFS family permease